MFKTLVKLKDVEPMKNIKWRPHQIAMTSDIINSYDIKKGIIKISSDNKVIDGNHRYMILFNHYGGEHEISVLRLPINRAISTFLVIGIGLIILPLIIVLDVINKKNKK